MNKEPNNLPNQNHQILSEIKDIERKIILDRFGTIPNDTGFKGRARIHQGWWRMKVLSEEPGDHPKDKGNNVCNTIRNGIINKKNFLTPNTIMAVDLTVSEREKMDAGLIEKDRLYNNLLSSQPLCFNFFGELMTDKEFGLKVLQKWWPNLTELKKVIFEYAPKERYTADNSAFDVAFEVSAEEKAGLIGLECKYTDTFSSTKYDKPEYRKIFERSHSFVVAYNELKVSKYNQLFRNQLIAEALMHNNKFDFVKTGLFCYPEDASAVRTGKELKNMLSNPDSFTIITYNDFIESVQRLELDWKKREWTMLLWARYCGTVLSDELNQFLKVNE